MQIREIQGRELQGLPVYYYEQEFVCTRKLYRGHFIFKLCTLSFLFNIGLWMVALRLENEMYDIVNSVVELRSIYMLSVR